MRKLLLLAAVAVTLGSCQKAPWQTEMVSRLDSMVVLSESHEEVLASLDSVALQEAAQEMTDFMAFFTQNLPLMDSLGVDKDMYTGPLKQMRECNKYYGRVLGSYTEKIDAGYNAAQLKSLRADVNRGKWDSATAVGYFNQEAKVLYDTDRRINKSYGGCYTCLRLHEELTQTLDSLKGFILEPNAQP